MVEKNVLNNLLWGMDYLEGSNGSYATSEMVAEYFEVKEDTVKRIIGRNPEFKNKYGVKVITGGILECVKYSQSPINRIWISSSNIPHLTIIPPLAIVCIGIRLTDSIKAYHFQKKILSSNDAELIQLLGDKRRNFHVKQLQFEEILRIFYGDRVEKQETIFEGKVRLDFLIDGYLNVEVDEYNHRNRKRFKDQMRDLEINKKLNYKIIRYNPDHNDDLQIFRVLKAIDNLLTK
jgi:hypothetical protein